MESTFTENKKVYTGSTQLLLAICIYCSFFKVNPVCFALALVLKLHICRWRQRTKRETCYFLHALPPFIPLLSHSYKAWDHYKCHSDRCKLSITLLGLLFEGFAAAQFIALLNRGWARQAPQLVQVTGMKEANVKAFYTLTNLTGPLFKSSRRDYCKVFASFGFTLTWQNITTPLKENEGKVSILLIFTSNSWKKYCQLSHLDKCQVCTQTSDLNSFNH